MKSLNRLIPRIMLVFAALVVNVAMDRVTKYFAVEILKNKEPIRFFWNSVVFVYTENTGAFLSLGNNWPELAKSMLFLIIPSLFCVAAIVYCLIKETDPVRNILITSIAAGGIANLYDRLFNSFRVIDFLNFGIGDLRTGILNIADMSITFGALSLIFYEYIKNKTGKVSFLKLLFNK